MNPIHPEFEVKGIVCPNCLTNYPGAEQIPVLEHEGIKVRSYMGACTNPNCLLGFEVCQIQVDGKWYNHWHQLYKTQPYGPRVWGIPLQAGVAEIPAEPAPAPPLVVLGPGGEYRREIRVTEESLRQSVRKSLGVIGDCFDALASLGRSKQTHSANAETNHEHNC